MNDQSHVVGAEMSVYDYNYNDDDGYPTTSAYIGSRDNARSAARWVEGYTQHQMTTEPLPAPHGSTLKIRVSNRHITGLVDTTACFFFYSARTFQHIVHFLIINISSIS